MVKPTHLLDTNVCIQLLRGKGDPILKTLRSHDPGSIAVCSITLGELTFGAKLSGKDQEAVRVARLMQDFVQLPFAEQEAWEYGEIRHFLHRYGTPIGQLDMMIGAAARAQGLIVVTHNVKDFRRIPDLRLEDWESTTRK